METNKIIDNSKFTELTKDAIDSITGFSCPKCGCIASDMTDESCIAMTQPEDSEELNDFNWLELHKCRKCETAYVLKNGC